ncbi:MAG: NnrS family protein, partial [Burkholderiales bacterium]|nr:NnrS family protein [Burkholderiales bacterium]
MAMPSPSRSTSPAAGPAPSDYALWNLGFRPFYLLAALFATISVPLWTAQYAGWLGTRAIIGGPLWHAHEMLFGYAFAVIVGFLFTAGRNWANLPTPTGTTLAAIAALWVAARVLVLTPYALAAAAFDTAFAVAAAAAIAVPFVRSGNRRNYFFIALLLGLGLANLVFHLGMAGLLDVALQPSLQAGMDLVLFIMVVMGGRVIPMFTMNGIPGVFCARLPWIERLAPGSILALLAADVLGAPEIIVGPLAALAAAVHATRLVLWRPWRTLRTPIVWILHCAYAWIALALALRALAAWDLVGASLATHAFTVGAIGGLTLGMMTRTSLGHTGRPLRAGRAEIFCYAAVQLAAL